MAGIIFIAALYYFKVLRSKNEDFEDDLKHKILYPDYNNAFWYVIGEPEDIPIGFSKMKCDFYIDCAIFGDFLDDFSFKFKRQEGMV